jgi:hypothetical protein
MLTRKPELSRNPHRNALTSAGLPLLCSLCHLIFTASKAATAGNQNIHPKMCLFHTILLSRKALCPLSIFLKAEHRFVKLFPPPVSTRRSRS